MRCVAAELAALPRARRRVTPSPPVRVAHAPRVGSFVRFHLGLPALGTPGHGDTMAWRSHGSDNASLVDALKRNRVIQDPRCVAPASAPAHGPSRHAAPRVDASSSTARTGSAFALNGRAFARTELMTPWALS